MGDREHSFQICNTQYRSYLCEFPELVEPGRLMPGFMHQWHLLESCKPLKKGIPHSCLFPGCFQALSLLTRGASTIIPKLFDNQFPCRSAATAQRRIGEPTGPTEDYNPEFEPTRTRGLQPSLPRQLFKNQS